MDLKRLALMKAQGKKYYHTTVNLFIDDVVMFIELKRKGFIPMDADLSEFARVAFHKAIMDIYQEASQVAMKYLRGDAL